MDTKRRRLCARRHNGVTLVETMVCVAVATILGSVAVPSFAALHRKAQRTAVVNDLVHSIYLARSEAVKRNSVVSVCRSNDGMTCANRAPTWNGGWLVFENLNHNSPASIERGEPILFHHFSIASGNLTSNRVSFSFRPNGQGDVTGTLVYCPAGGVAPEARAVIISHTGRPRISIRDADGRALRC